MGREALERHRDRHVPSLLAKVHAQADARSAGTADHGACASRDAGYVIGTYSASINTLELDDAIVGRSTKVLAVAKSRVDDVTTRLEEPAPRSLGT